MTSELKARTAALVERGWPIWVAICLAGIAVLNFPAVMGTGLIVAGAVLGLGSIYLGRNS